METQQQLDFFVSHGTISAASNEHYLEDDLSMLVTPHQILKRLLRKGGEAGPNYETVNSADNLLLDRGVSRVWQQPGCSRAGDSVLARGRSAPGQLEWDAFTGRTLRRGSEKDSLWKQSRFRRLGLSCGRYRPRS